MSALQDLAGRLGPSGAGDVPVAESAQARRHWLAVLDQLWTTLARRGDAPGDAVLASAALLSQEPRVAWLIDVFGLDAVDVALVLLAAAPELDPRFAELCAGRHGWLALVARTADERLALRARLAPGHLLQRQRILVAAQSTAEYRDASRGAALVLDAQLLDALLYEEGMDHRLLRYCRLVDPAVDLRAVALEAGQWRPLLGAVRHALNTRAPLHLQFTGLPGSGRRHAAEAMAQQLGLRLLVADMNLLGDGPLDEALAPLLREAWLREALLYVEGFDTCVAQAGNGDALRLLDALAEDGGMAIFATAPGWLPPPRSRLCLHVVAFGDLDAARRRRLWRRALIARGHSPDLDGLEALAYRFRLSPAQIDRAVRDAEWLVRMRGDGAGAPLLAVPDLQQAARDQAPRDLAQLARKVAPVARWQDLVLPEDSSRQLRELCERVALAPKVMGDWGFGERMSLGRGTSALFAGPSGTGKTMAAEIIAGELGLDLYKIDLATVVSKYIGETEKNLDRVFTAARNANAILFFDEADSIFGKRSEVRDSHDRYANLEISYLLQKMEEYDGLALLSTNLKQNLDEAFLRRLTYIVLFPFPDASDRERIWRQVWPPALVLGDDVDLSMLAAEFKLAGGNIRNASLAAAYFAAADTGVVSMRHVVHGIRRELQKVGKAIGDFPRLAVNNDG